MRKLVLIALFLVATAPAWATFTVTVNPTARALHLEMTDLSEVGGQPKRAELFWRENGQTTWKRAQDLRRQQHDYILGTGSPVLKMSGVIMGLNEASAYDWKITVTKQDDSQVSEEGLNVSTVSLSPPVGGSDTLTVNPGDNVEAVVAAFMANGQPIPGKTIQFASGRGSPP